LVDLIGFVKSWGAVHCRRTRPTTSSPDADGALTRDELIAHYEERSGRCFRDHRAYYEALSLWKSIGIFEGVHARSVGSRFVDDVPELVARLHQLVDEQG
jgi:aminoglycoside phosphotransferase (APT) family kinase protein